MRNLSFLMLLLLSMVVGTPASAQSGGLRGQMDQVFGSMSNVTSPDTHMGMRRGVISGGSIVVRNRVVQEQPFNLELPHWNGGCSGVDFYGGSLSFISKRQFEALLRSIASNASGYAFELGMNALCPQCAQEMARLQKIMQDLSGKMLDSCMAAKKLVNMTSLDELSEKRAQQATAEKTQSGTFSSFLDQYLEYNGENQAAVASQENPSMAPHLQYNVMWKALKASGAKDWFPASSEQDLYEELMSLTGFVIVINPGQTAECPNNTDVPNAKAQPCVFTKPATLSLRDLIFGMGTTSNGGRSDPQVYRCDDSECLNFHTESIEFAGLSEQIKRMLVGGPSSTGLIDKMNSMNGSLNMAELTFLSNTGSLGTMIRNLVSFREIGAAKQIALDGSPQLGTAMVYQMAFQSMRTMQYALGNSHVAETAMAMANLERRLTEITEERRAIDAEAAINDKIVAYYNSVMRARPPSYLPNMDLGQKTKATTSQN